LFPAFVGLVFAALCALSSPARAGKPADDVAKVADAQIAAWSKDGDPDDAVAKLYTKDASFSVTGGAASDDAPEVDSATLGSTLINAVWIVKSKVSTRAVSIAKDGKTAWVSFGLHVKVDRSENGRADFPEYDYRATEILVSTSGGWKLAGGTWSQAQPNAKINKEAAAGKPRTLAELPASHGDKTLLDAFSSLLRSRLGPSATARTDLVVIGSGPGERTVGGAKLAKAWDAAWQGHLAALGSPAVHVAPSGTTGWVIANVELTKKVGAKSYVIPFRVCFVFDKDDAATWTLAHAHFAVGPSPAAR
jgi:ketosteroid isomerase-like protein